MNTRKIKNLLPFEDNSRETTIEAIDRAAKILDSMGQTMPLLITPAGDNEHDIVLGGNQRIKAMRQLNWETVKVSVVEFFENDSGLWQAILDGDIQKKEYTSKEAGMMEYSLAENTRFARYVEDMLSDAMKDLEIDSALYTVDLVDPTELTDLEESLNKALETSTPQEQTDPPEYTDTDAQEREEAQKLFKLIVYFKDEEERQAYADKTRAIGFDCKLA